MNVLLLNLDEALHMGRRMTRLARVWMDEGLVRPRLACPRRGALAALADEQGVPLLPLRGTHPFNPLVFYPLLKAARSCDVLLSWGIDAGLCAWLTRRCKGLAHVIAHWDDSVELTRRQKIWYAQAGAVVCPTQELAEQLAGVVPGLCARTVDLPLDPAAYAPRRDRQDGRFVFMALGDLVEERGHQVLLEAMGLLQDMDGLPPWEVRIVGSGPCFEALLDKARSLEVDHRLSLLGSQDRHVMLPQADALVAPDVKSEAAALTIKEAWATGLPVIASSVGAHAELLRNKDNALLTPAGNPVTLAAAMMRCMQDEALRTMLVQHGAASLPHYTEDRLARQMADICTEAHATAVAAAAAAAAPSPSPPPASESSDATEGR